MNKCNNLVDIVYSETIEQYVIVLKRFPDKPVIIDSDCDFWSVYEFYNDDKIESIVIYDMINDAVNDDIFYGLDIHRKENNDKFSIILPFKYSESNGTWTSTSSNELETKLNLRITELEKFEIINKMLELREILIERGEIDE